MSRTHAVAAANARRLLIVAAMAGLSCSMFAGPTLAKQPGGQPTGQPGSQPAIQPVRPEDVPPAVREAHERRMREQATKATQPVAPSPAAAQAPADLPPVVRETPKTLSTDADVLAMVATFGGTFSTPASGAQPELHLSAALINVDGLDNAMYFELARADEPWKPFRQGVMHFYKRQGKLHLRQFEFGRTFASFGGAVAGMWAAPEVFPKISLGQLVVTMDMPVTRDGENFSAATTQPVPTTLAGAVEVTSAWKGNAKQIAFVDRGFDAAGKEVFGPAGGSTTFTRSTSPVKSEKRANGIVVIDFKPADAGARTLEAGNDAAVHYTGWLTTGEIFGTSRPSDMGQPGEDTPLRFTHGNMIPGFNDAILGIGRGAVRRLYIPAALGYGARNRGRIPANSDLIFTLETLWIDQKIKNSEAEGANQAPMTPATTPTIVPTTTPSATPETKKPN